MERGILYKEKPKPAFFYPVPLTIDVIVCAVIIILIVLWGELYDRIFSTVALALLIVSCLTFLRPTVTVTDESLIMRMGLIRAKTDREAIDAVELIDMSYSNYLGFGVYYLNKKKPFVLNPRKGPGLKVLVTGSGRTYLIGTDRPEELLSALVSPDHNV